MFKIHWVLWLLLGLSLGIFLSLSFAYLIFEQNVHLDRLFYSLPGAIVGLASLGWNMINQSKIRALSNSNEQKTYALAAFDAYAADPIRKAIDIIDEIIDEIEGVRHDNSHGTKTFRAKIKKIIEEKVMIKVTRAYRLCGEADQYMEQKGYKTQFEKNMYEVSDEEKLDDVILINLSSALEEEQPKIALDAKLRNMEKIITSKKVYIRSLITEASEKIASSYS